MTTETKYQVQESRWPAKTFLGIKAKLGFHELGTFIQQSYEKIYEALKQHKLDVNAMPYAIYYSVDPQKNELELAAVAPVPPGTNIPGFETINIPESKAISVTYYGSYEKMGPAYAELENYCAEHKLKKQLALEEYWTDPLLEPDQSKWKTIIYFIVS